VKKVEAGAGIFGVRAEECREISGKSSTIIPQAFLEAGLRGRPGWGKVPTEKTGFFPRSSGLADPHLEKGESVAGPGIARGTAASGREADETP